MVFDEYLLLWSLTPDGAPILTHSSQLLPVIYQGKSAMLKVALDEEERKGGALMAWWDGDEGAAPVFQHDGDALLMERATGGHLLYEMAQMGGDDEATKIICACVAKLHVIRKDSPPELIPLDVRFRELFPAAKKQGGILQICAGIAKDLLASQKELRVLHGDIHHANILDFGEKGWRAIDPKCLSGDRCFDYANIFCNPDIEVATAPGRLSRQVDVVCKAADLERERLLKWIIAYAGLSAAWTLGDNREPELALAIAKIAINELII